MSKETDPPERVVYSHRTKRFIESIVGYVNRERRSNERQEWVVEVKSIMNDIVF